MGKSFVQRHQIVRLLGNGKVEAVDILTGAAASPLEAAFAASAFDKNSSHRFRGSGEEMAAAVPALSNVLVHQPQISLMDQGGGLQSVARLFLGHFLGR